MKFHGFSMENFTFFLGIPWRYKTGTAVLQDRPEIK